MTPTTEKTDTSAFAKDRLFGKRVDQEFAEGQPFLLLGGVLEPEIETSIGPATPAKLLVRRVNEELDATGSPYIVKTLASAIVEKVRALQPTDVPVLVNVRSVQSKRRGAKALVLELYRVDDDGDVKAIAGEFGIELGDHGDKFGGL